MGTACSQFDLRDVPRQESVEYLRLAKVGRVERITHNLQQGLGTALLTPSWSKSAAMSSH
jgi:hypothetical protein